VVKQLLSSQTDVQSLSATEKRVHRLPVVSESSEESIEEESYMGPDEGARRDLERLKEIELRLQSFTTGNHGLGAGDDALFSDRSVSETSYADHLDHLEDISQ